MAQAAFSWNAQAKECYRNGSDCRACSVPRLMIETLYFNLNDDGEIDTNCKVKEAIPKIIEIHGLPKDDPVKKISGCQLAG